jgi:non-ribosomal peptide synthetase component F
MPAAMTVTQTPGPSGPPPSDPIPADLATRKEKSLWLLEKLAPAGGVNNVAYAFQADGVLHSDVLERAIAVVVGRYGMLRTVFVADGSELRKRVLPADGVPVTVERRTTSRDTRDEDLVAFVGRPFDLDGQPLFRAALFTHPDGDVFAMAVHHLVFDAISIGVFMQALVPVYDTLAAGLPLPADAGTAVPTFHEPEPSADGMAFWHERLSGYRPDSLRLWCGPQNGASSGADTSLAAAIVTHSVSAEARAAVARLQRQVRAPEAAILLAAYVLLLAAHGAGPDLVVGTPVDLRTPEAASAIGYHINVVPLRFGVDFAEGFRAFAKRARATFMSAITHADVSVEDVALELPKTGTSWRDMMLYRHMFNYFPGLSSAGFALGGVSAWQLSIGNGHGKFDLEFFLRSAPDALDLRAAYLTETLTRSDAEALLLRYEAILIAADADPDRPLDTLPIWSGPDRAVIEAANRTAATDEPRTVLERIHSHAAATPQATAVVDGGRELTYRRLWESSNAIRDSLERSGVRQGDVVAVAAARGAEAIAGLLGVWRAGATCLPLDAEAGSVALVTRFGAAAVLKAEGVSFPEEARLPPLLPLAVGSEANATTGPDPTPQPDAPAVLIHTGASVGVLLSHRGLDNQVAHFAAEFAAGPATVTVALADFPTAESVLESLLPLAVGGCVVIAPDDARTAGSALRATLEHHDFHGAGILQVPGAMSPRILEEAADALAGFQIVAGAPLPPAVVSTLLTAGIALYDGYGSAETTGWSLCARVDGAGRPARGRPVRNARAFVLAPDGRELPVGVRGELCVAGDAVALGYVDDAEQTEQRFPSHPHHGRYHRTGRLARWRPDGTVEWFGEIGRRLVVAGQPLDPAEVEAAVLDQPGVHAAAVTLTPHEDRDVLVAFVEARVPADSVRAGLSARLSAAAMPEHIVCLDTLPRNRRSVDHRALALLAAELPLGDGAGREPAAAASAELIDGLVGLWAKVLRHEATPETNFFAEGGSSLLAAVLAQNIDELTGSRLELTEIFAHPTPAALAVRIAELGGDTSGRE